MTSEEAATTPIAFFTAVQLLFIRLEIAEPPADGSAAQSSGRWIYIHSGATAVGHFAIQLAKLSGLKVAASSSPHNFDLLKKLGADVVVNYRDEDFAQQVKKATDDSVELGIDCITDGTLAQAVTVFGPKGGKIATILPSEAKLPRDDVEVRKTLVCVFARPATLIAQLHDEGRQGPEARSGRVQGAPEGPRDPRRLVPAPDQAERGRQDPGPSAFTAPR